MDVRPSAEQRALIDAAEQMVDRLGPRSVAALADAERRDRLRAAVDSAGWLELRTADDSGAPWATGVEVGIVAEALGRGVADTAFIGPTLAAELRRRAGLPAASAPETVVFTTDLGAPAMAEGASLAHGGLAVDVPPGGSTALVLVPDGDRFTVAGTEVAAVDTTTDLTRTVSRVEPGAAVVPLGGGGGGAPGSIDAGHLQAWTALGLAACCADQVGVMDGAVRMATDYAAARSQYGRPVGSFQAVQHLLADALVLAEGSRSISRHATWAVDASGPAEALAAASVATAYCSRAARTVCEIVIQVHGGIGNTWECMAHVFLRRALLSTDLLGGVGPALERVLEGRGVAGSPTATGGRDGLR